VNQGEGVVEVAIRDLDTRAGRDVTLDTRAGRDVITLDTRAGRDVVDGT